MANNLIGRGWTFPPQLGIHGGVALTTERNEIDQAIWIILSTAQGERVMRPTFGSRLHELVYAPLNNETFAQAKRYVQDALGMWEPRIRLIAVEVRAQQAKLLIEIQYEIKTTRDQRTLVYPFYLIPGE